MPAQPIFPLCTWTHDPSGQSMDYTIPIPLPDGDSIASATVTVVDANDVALIETPISPDTALVITAVAFAAISGTIWGVTFLATGGIPGTVYHLRCRYTLAGSPARGSDRTVRLACAQT